MNKIIITTGVVAVVGGLVTALTMSSCDTCEPGPEKASVIVQLIDDSASATATVNADAVWYEYTNDEGEVVKEQGRCLDPEEGCTEWQLGHGGAGDYSFHAEVCGNQFDSAVRVEYTSEDGCEIETQIVDLKVSSQDCPKQFEAPEPPEPPQMTWDPPRPQLEWVPQDYPQFTWVGPTDPACTLEARFSVVGKVVTELDGRMVPLEARRIYYIQDPREVCEEEVREQDSTVYRPACNEETPAMCLDSDCHAFAVAFEQEGTFRIGAEACGQNVETTIVVGRTEDGCHVDTKQIVLEVDSAKCTSELPLEVAEPTEPEGPPPARCPEASRVPSAYLMPIVQEGDMLRPWPTKDLTFIQRGVDGDAKSRGFCAAPAPDGRCTLWIAGWGETGTFTAQTSTCGVESSVQYEVGLDDQACPQTNYVPLTMDTHGCIAAPGPKLNPPPPVTPAAGEDVRN